MNNIKINQRFCKRCGICVEFCPAKVLGKESDGLPFVIYQDKCIGCKLCEYRCPDFAIKVEVTGNEIK